MKKIVTSGYNEMFNRQTRSPVPDNKDFPNEKSDWLDKELDDEGIGEVEENYEPYDDSDYFDRWDPFEDDDRETLDYASPEDVKQVFEHTYQNIIQEMDMMERELEDNFETSGQSVLKNPRKAVDDLRQHVVRLQKCFNAIVNQGAGS